jgi:hypothetical protein
VNTEVDVAIVNSVKTSHKCIAICEVYTLDVLGNKKDGWEVNDRFKAQDEVFLTVDMYVSNMPKFPGAKDAYRSFPNSGSFYVTEALVYFQIPVKEIKEALGVKCKLDIDGDDQTFYISRMSDGYPLGEIVVKGYKEAIQK